MTNKYNAVIYQECEDGFADWHFSTDDALTVCQFFTWAVLDAATDVPPSGIAIVVNGFEFFSAEMGGAPHALLALQSFLGVDLDQ